jgi:hypothetical protein
LAILYLQTWKFIEVRNPKLGKRERFEPVPFRGFSPPARSPALRGEGKGTF